MEFGSCSAPLAGREVDRVAQHVNGEGRRRQARCSADESPPKIRIWTFLDSTREPLKKASRSGQRFRRPTAAVILAEVHCMGACDVQGRGAGLPGTR